MAPVSHQWQRFWCSRDGSMSLSDDGYLVDPKSKYGRTLNPHVRSFAEISPTQCLVLLGEPGMGKSTALATEFDSLRQGSDPSITILTDLRSYGSEDRLHKYLTESTVIRNWVDGSEALHLFLDSLDECLLRIDTLATLLADALSQLPTDRLTLRVACRTGDWPQTLEGHLADIFGKNNIGVYELAPLRRVDVATAATSVGLDPSEFLREVAEVEVQALANRPVTLDFLLRAKQQRRDLPRRKVALYSQGCRILAAETNLARREAGYAGRLGADQRLRVAEHVASATVFANRYAIWTGSEAGPVQPEDVAFEAFRSGLEAWGGVENETFEEVVGTGLFSSRGSQRMGWAHQTYAEYLAACWATTNALELDQLLGLLTNPHDPDNRLVPQLHETAAWIASMRSDAFQALVERDPEALLRGDVATAEPEQRQALAQALLDGYATERLVDTDWSLRPLYRKLRHPGLAEQLRTFIADRGLGAMVRRAAINIAEACRVTELQEDLILVALGREEQSNLREAAAGAAAAIADPEHRLKLRPLLETTISEDPDDQLRAPALRALWPDQLPVEELFHYLQQPRRPNLYGSYKAFLRYDLPSTLTEQHLPTALEWVLEQEPSRHASPDVLEDLADEILMRVWRSRPSGQMREQLADIVLRRRRAFLPIIGDDHQRELANLLQEDPEARKTFLLAILERMTPEDDVWSLWTGGPALIDDNCLAWLLDWQVRGEGSEAAKLRGAEAIRHLYDPRNADQVCAVLDAVAESPTLRAVMNPYFAAVELGSPLALEMKARHEEHLERVREHERWRAEHFKPVNPPPAERLRTCLDRIEAGNPDGFWQMAMELTLKHDSRHYETEIESDLTTLPGWEGADRHIRTRIINAAKHYILEGDPGAGDWIGTDILHRPALAGYKALRLLLTLDPAFLASLAPGIWMRWAATVVAYPSHGIAEADRYAQRELVSQAYRVAPDVTLLTLLKCLEADNEKLGMVFGLDRFELCWDDRLSRCLLGKACEPGTKPRPFQQILSLALSHGLAEAASYIRELLEQPLPDEGPARERAVMAGMALLLSEPRAAWSLVKPIIERDERFGRALVSELAREAYSSLLGELPEQDLADFFVWISRQYPYSEDSRSDGGWLGPRDQVATLRNAMLHALKERGSFEASRAIESVMDQLPVLDWLKYALHDARAVARARTWEPPSPEEVLALGGSRVGRLVRSGGELLDAIVASLRRLEEKLQGETPAAVYLWNGPDSARRFSPKDEETLSNYVKLHLDEDLKRKGIMVNREVQIRRGEGLGAGERTDIHVDAIFRDSRSGQMDVLTAIIEVKGCWNAELDTAMKSQLVGRYLKDNACRNGLYLVGWYNCPQWDPTDRRSRPSASRSQTDAREQLEAEAKRLSSTELDIRAFVLNTGLR